jgi:hypothetical protein
MRISQHDGYDASTCYDAVGSEIRNRDQFQKLTILKVMTLCDFTSLRSYGIGRVRPVHL